MSQIIDIDLALFRPMTTSEVARYLKVSRRTLEEWRRRTKELKDLYGPPFSQDYEGARTTYPEICVRRFGLARLVGHSIPEATRYGAQPLIDLDRNNFVHSQLDYSLPTDPPTMHQNLQS